MDPLAEKYANVSPYIYTFNNPINLTDPSGMEPEITGPPSTDVTKNEDGTYTVVGGNLNDGDKGIYVVDGEGNRTGEKIGESLTMHSFYNADTWDADDGMKTGWVGTIDPNSTESGDLVSNFVENVDKIFIGSYMANATDGKKYDFKRAGDPKNSDRDFHHRGSIFDTKSDGTSIFASARDAGNYAAGYIAGINDMSWGTARFGFDGLEFLKSTNTEGLQSTSAQRLGHNHGYPIGRAKTFEREYRKATNPWPIGPKY